MCHGRRLQKSLRMIGDSSTLSVRDMRRHLRLSVIFPPSFGIRPTAAQMTWDKAPYCRSSAAVRSVYVYMIHPLFSHFNPFSTRYAPLYGMYVGSEGYGSGPAPPISARSASFALPMRRGSLSGMPRQTARSSESKVSFPHPSGISLRRARMTSPSSVKYNIDNIRPCG